MHVTYEKHGTQGLDALSISPPTPADLIPMDCVSYHHEANRNQSRNNWSEALVGNTLYLYVELQSKFLAARCHKSLEGINGLKSISNTEPRPPKTDNILNSNLSHGFNSTKSAFLEGQKVLELKHLSWIDEGHNRMRNPLQKGAFVDG